MPQQDHDYKMNNHAVLLIHIFATFSMTGVIWLVQCVHYPMFEWIAGEHQKKAAMNHQRNISWVVVPLMFAELFSGFFLYITNRSSNLMVWKFNFFLIIGAWLCTFLIQVPMHQKMLQGFDQKLVGRLVFSNWIRTLIWTVRSSIILIYLCNLHAF